MVPSLESFIGQGFNGVCPGVLGWEFVRLEWLKKLALRRYFILAIIGRAFAPEIAARPGDTG